VDEIGFVMYVVSNRLLCIINVW